MEDLFHISETRIAKAIFPNTLNSNQSLFGGKAMQWMDEAAFISATRFTRQRMFTAHTSPIRFLQKVPVNSIIEVVARVTKAESVKLTVKVEVFAEDIYTNKSYKAIESDFVLVSLNDKDKPQRIDYSNILSSN